LYIKKGVYEVNKFIQNYVWGSIQGAEITIDYIKERMLNMWGVIFEFTGKEGRIEGDWHPEV
jgi:hypothetical protein